MLITELRPIRVYLMEFIGGFFSQPITYLTVNTNSCPNNWGQINRFFDLSGWCGSHPNQSKCLIEFGEMLIFRCSLCTGLRIQTLHQ